MGFCTFFWVLGIIFLFIEYWFLTHLYQVDGYLYKEDSWEKIPFKVLHLILLIILNVIPVANVIGFISILLIPAVDDDKYFRLVPPKKEDKTKMSKLDKLLNKKL